jgi:aminoglycoside phosphotransferase (APT) family kinase protein
LDSPIFEPVPEPQREPARSALAAVFGPAGVTAIERVSGGASGALTYRVEAEGRSFFLRIEARLDAPFRNPHQYDCMRIAAEAGIAPPLRYADAGTGTAIMDFMPTRPLTDYPGGPPALARDLGRLVARLQQTSPFPAHFEFPKIVAWLLGHLRTSGLFADGLLDAHAAGFERIREAYVWDPAECVSSHNEPNPNNVIFDGERLWLIDWESACRNDRLTDVAILTQYLVPAPELQAALVESWLGRPPDAYLSARLTLMRQLTRLYYAGLLFSVAARGARAEPETDLSAPTPAEFGAAVAAGRHTPGSPETMCVLGKMSLAAFRAGLDDPGFEESLAIARAG